MLGAHVLFKSGEDHWATPEQVYRSLDAEFHFTLDPCPLGGSGGLELSWLDHRVYCNPPYGRGVGKWLAKSDEAKVSVYLLPSRTDTPWWHEWAMKASEIRFIRGRLKFGGAKHNAPFPSAIVIFDNRTRFNGL